MQFYSLAPTIFQIPELNQDFQWFYWTLQVTWFRPVFFKGVQCSGVSRYMLFFRNHATRVFALLPKYKKVCAPPATRFHRPCRLMKSAVPWPHPLHYLRPLKCTLPLLPALHICINPLQLGSSTTTWPQWIEKNLLPVLNYFLQYVLIHSQILLL